MPAAVDINELNESELRDLVARMQRALGDQESQLHELDTAIEQLKSEKETQLQERDSVIQRLTIEKQHLTHEIAILRRHRYGKRSESGSSSPQQSLLDDLVDEDIAAIENELEQLAEPLTTERQRSTPRRQATLTTSPPRRPCQSQ